MYIKNYKLQTNNYKLQTKNYKLIIKQMQYVRQSIIYGGEVSQWWLCLENTLQLGC